MLCQSITETILARKPASCLQRSYPYAANFPKSRKSSCVSFSLIRTPVRLIVLKKKNRPILADPAGKYHEFSILRDVNRLLEDRHHLDEPSCLVPPRSRYFARVNCAHSWNTMI